MTSQPAQPGGLRKLFFCCASDPHTFEPVKSHAPEPIKSTPPPEFGAVAADGKEIEGTVVHVVPDGKKSFSMTKVYIVFYSMYGHIYKLAQTVKEGVDAVESCEGVLYQVPETLPKEVLEKMHAPPKPDVPVITAKELPDADGILLGIPTRFGMMPAQLKAFFDSTGQLWQSNGLVGKPAGVFISTATQGGGMETTALTAVTQFTHHGMIFVPPGYSFGTAMFDTDTVHGGSPWGAGTFAGATGARQPSEMELSYAKYQGEYFAKVAKKLKA